MPSPGERVRLRVVSARPGYRRLWSARTASQWGDVFATVALSLVVFDLTGPALGVSVVVAVEIIPVPLFAPFAGTMVDRLPRGSGHGRRGSAARRPGCRSDHLGLPPSGYGMLLGAIGVGAVLGPFLLTRLADHRPERR